MIPGTKLKKVLMTIGLSLVGSAGGLPGRAIGAAEGVGTLFGELGKKATVSAHVVRLSDGVSLFELKPDQLVSPASVTKIMTAATALSKLTPHHLYKTKFLTTSKRVGATMQGDLFIVGEGDPFIVSEKMWQLAADFKNMGIKEFTGDIVIDNSLFDDEMRDESRAFGEVKSSHAYDAPVSPFAVNFNTTAITMGPGAKVGAAGIVGLDPYPLRPVKIESRLKTGAAGSKDKTDVTRMAGAKGESKLIVSGTVADEPHLKKLYRSVGDPVTTSGEYVRAFLDGVGIKVRGRVRAGVAPKWGLEIYTLESFPMSFIVAGLNKFSNNFIADMLVKRLGAEFGAAQPLSAGSGTMANGSKVIEKFLREDVGINSNFVINNGSGLDTGNRLSARQITSVLQYMERRMDAFPEFLASLPASGWDGTLDKRFKGDKEFLKGQIRAKTGTLSEPISVVGLAGYLRHPKHGLIGFAILENGIVGKPQPGVADLRDHQDQVVAALMKM